LVYAHKLLLQDENVYDEPWHGYDHEHENELNSN
jgi:hypothetical protein